MKQNQEQIVLEVKMLTATMGFVQSLAVEITTTIITTTIITITIMEDLR